MYGATLSLHNIEQSYFVAVQAPSTSTSPATCQDQTVRTVDTISRGLLQVVGPGSTQSRLRWARRCPCQWEWRAVAPCCCLTCLFSENRNLIMSRWRESCSYHQLSLFFRLLDNRNEMASDHPEQNEGDQENTEQNDLQQIEDLKIQVHTYNSNIHNSAIIHSTPSLCNEILPGPSSACQCWHLIVTPGGSVPVSLDTYLKVTSHESQSSLSWWFFNWFVSSGCQRRAHDQASTTGNIIRFNSTHTVKIVMEYSYSPNITICFCVSCLKIFITQWNVRT